MKIDGATVLVTGANRGLGREFARQFARHGASVCAGARDPLSITDPLVKPIQLDVTSQESVEIAVREAGDVSILINNAGVLGPDPRTEMDVNYFGPLRMIDAFAPVLARNGGGAIVNVLSVLSFVGWPRASGYAASKAAAWSLTKSTRQALASQGTLVVAVHAGFIDTDMAADVDAPKITPESVVAQVIEALVLGRDEVLADETSRAAKAGLVA
ncbi:short-chain dehydrogenase [Lentzea sp. NBRC 105346]|uniref:SDR family oxidoreductase n=1 Tax=Lentzea sp. NBRC 105346 TaxID=3032205 RepID=UPI0024A337C6|nr:SDR family oxidoreductase [Lentzea sp. NBRC 105346]GLZ34713.1 short-chain dehydrogenase [Lentzea sp. NBRC 105346]